MATYPFKVNGACVSTDKNVFKVKFSERLSSLPQLRAYDNNADYPNSDTTVATTFRIFQGSAANNNRPMLYFIDTARVGPSSSSWYAEATYAAGVATCMMCGDASYLTPRYSIASMVANASITWNALLRVPCDVNPTMTKLHNIVCRYTFTSTIPVVNFYANNKHEGGTNGVPVWGTITDGSVGIRFGSAAATHTSILANIPLITVASLENTETAWVTET
ncbi:hypothetical protein M0R04_05815 [Candidatus Dojkabacteria bacterium]|jgi:hypothetical protein|nr:hypothetical protein [Candidatus Dojkabacteria bacterium]